MQGGKQMKAKLDVRRIGRHFLIATAAGGAVLGSAALILTRQFAEAAWQDAPPNTGSIYERGGSGSAAAGTVPVISPFHLHVDPMKALLLVNFEKDPDRIYLGLEPQAFDDDIHGRGLLVIGWRVDGRVDVFHEPGLRLDPQTYGIAGKGLHRMVERSFLDGRFELLPTGAQVQLGFQDLEGRDVRLHISETDTRPRHPFAFLAPMGGAASDPPALPLVFVHEFYFVRHAGSEVRIEIDGRQHRADAIPLVLDGAPVRFTRYSADPFIVTWNADAGAAARVLEVEAEPVDGTFLAGAGGVRYVLEANGEFLEIRRMYRRERHHQVTVEFAPAFPHLLALRNGVELSGTFRISTDPPAGAVTGRWRVARHGEEIRMEAVPEGGWTPGEAPRMARLLFRVVSTFQSWPSTYIWRGSLRLPPTDVEMEGGLHFESSWERKLPGPVR
jgi:hypothetical protein